jgi:signal transduction histidine kinase
MPDYRFSGHESFPCRYAWLPKAVSALQDNPQIFSTEEREAISELGVGKNMVRAIVNPKSRSMKFSDNGPGVGKSLADEIFKPFFSTKDRRRRQGLGLYIARECAEYNHAQLYLSDEHTEHKTRLNTFILELPPRDA